MELDFTFDFLSTYKLLKGKFNITDPEIYIEELDLKIKSHQFSSEPVEEMMEDNSAPSKLFKALTRFFLSHNEYSDKYLFHKLEMRDSEILENINFRYFVFNATGTENSESAIIMLHGLNEKLWEKYLPWAYAVSKMTGKPVILFPLAFHMNRAPVEWSDFRLMNNIVKERNNLLPGISESCFANTALSARLQFVPLRFLSSGLQSFNDITHLSKSILAGEIEGLEKIKHIDLFGYSIGAFVTQILMMRNPENLFTNSKGFLFCGGPLMQHMTPVSRAIMDSAAAEAIEDFYVINFDNNLQRDEALRKMLDKHNQNAEIFKSMISHDRNKELRESIFEKISDRLFCLGLLKDNVMSAEGIFRTFRMKGRKNPGIEIDDFHYKYSHENPFPLLEKLSEDLNETFFRVFRKASLFLS